MKKLHRRRLGGLKQGGGQVQVREDVAGTKSESKGCKGVGWHVGAGRWGVACPLYGRPPVWGKRRWEWS